jgi:hypothetical protein
MEDRYTICKIASDLDPIEREDDDETINKAWYSIGELGKCLFKAKTTTPGSLTEYRTDWSEKVVERIANLLGLPVAQYELATAYLNDSAKPIEGVISVNCIPENASVSSGGFFLYQTFDNALRRRYTVENILASLDLRNVKPSSQWTEDKKILQIDTGAKVFVGYLLLDAFVHNDDRHGANWGVMSIEGTLELISSFDHGVSLGSRNSDEDKLSRSLSEHTNESSFSHFKDKEGSLSVFNTFVRAAQLYPEAANIWLEKLRAITPEQIDKIFERIPEGRITPTSAKFAQDLIAYNRTELLQTYQTVLESNSSLITFSDINNYREYLNSREYKQQLSEAERGNLGRKASEIIAPLMKQFRSIARAEAGEFLPAPHPYFRSFKTEMDLSQRDRIGIEEARDWASRQPKIEEEKGRDERSRGR